ncbi:MAG: single-stranded DNA-binding protein [Acidimicrobiales bacterium]|nr:single-stranded DNA-binding protein [Acidimicrobiales bacterium]MBO0887092.1 single-stranded DNA-binding protein [Acidimicrobiales bacterium]
MVEYEPVNVAVLRGRLSRPATSRVLPSGDRLASFEVTVEQAGLRAETVPVVWFDAPASVASLDVGELVVVVGRVRRRFFRAGDQTQSRTEVVADRVVPLRQEERARRAVERATAVLLATPGTSGRSAEGRPSS